VLKLQKKPNPATNWAVSQECLNKKLWQSQSAGRQQYKG